MLPVYVEYRGRKQHVGPMAPPGGTGVFYSFVPGIPQGLPKRDADLLLSLYPKMFVRVRPTTVAQPEPAPQEDRPDDLDEAPEDTKRRGRPRKKS